MKTIWTEMPPKAAGHYWRKERGKITLVEVNVSWPPKHWKTARARCLKTIREAVKGGLYSAQDIAPLVDQPLEWWKIEWSAKLVPPSA